MEKKESPKEPMVTPLNENQKNKVIEDLHKRGATFFTWETLQNWIRQFGPNAKVADVQKKLKDQSSEEPKQ